MRPKNPWWNPLFQWRVMCILIILTVFPLFQFKPLSLFVKGLHIIPEAFGHICCTIFFRTVIIPAFIGWYFNVHFDRRNMILAFSGRVEKDGHMGSVVIYDKKELLICELMHLNRKDTDQSFIFILSHIHSLLLFLMYLQFDM